MTVTARWSYTAALHRNESRGIHRRLDAPSTDPAFARPIAVSGLDSINVAYDDARTVEVIAS